MDAARYFHSMYRDEEMLRSHGFEAWPDVEELARYVFALEERVDALAAAASDGPGRGGLDGPWAGWREGVS